MKFRQGNCPEPPKFESRQLVRVTGHIDLGRVGEVIGHYTTEECGHPEPYEHIYVSLAGRSARATYYERELEAVKVVPA